MSARPCFLSLLATGSELCRTGESGMTPSSCSGDGARWSWTLPNNSRGVEKDLKPLNRSCSEAPRNLKPDCS